jgi:hypothetical protein
MGKVIISTHITLDGVIGPSPERWAILEGEGERQKFDLAPGRGRIPARAQGLYEGPASVWPTMTR